MNSNPHNAPPEETADSDHPSKGVMLFSFILGLAIGAATMLVFSHR